MKKKKFYLMIITLVMIVSSCEDDFLDRVPLDATAETTYFQTTQQLDLYMNRFYGEIPVTYQYLSGIYDRGHHSDNLIWEIKGVSPIVNGEITVPGTNTIFSEWRSEYYINWDFSIIRDINVFLTNYSRCEDPFDNYKHYVGEAHFFRAFFYFKMLREFGELPWLNKPLLVDSEELYAPRLPRNQVADSIIADLDKAIELMNTGRRKAGTELGSEVAAAFKSRVCIYEGTWEKYHAGTVFAGQGNPNDYFQEAVDAAKIVMESGNYSIYSTGDYENDYYMLSNRKDYSPINELIFFKHFDQNQGMYHRLSRWLIRWPGGRSFTQPFVDSYLCTDGLPVSVSPLYKGPVYPEVGDNRDPRLKQTVFFPGAAMKVEGTYDPPLVVLDTFTKPKFDVANSKNGCPGMYQMRKFSEPDAHLYDVNWFGDMDFMLIRYAEVLLNYAEAQAELGMFNQADAYLTINQLRDRVNMPHLDIGSIATDPNWEFPNISPLLNEIRRERRVELVNEVMRIDDIKRWRAHHLITGVQPITGKFAPDYFGGNERPSYYTDDGFIAHYKAKIPNGYGFNPDRDYLFPIPYNQLTLNENLVQNPGWGGQ